MSGELKPKVFFHVGQGFDRMDYSSVHDADLLNSLDSAAR